MKSLTDLPLPAVVALAVAIALQVGLQILALVRLSQAPAETVSFGGRKWLWALIILVGELAGPIAYFVAGRRPAVANEAPTAGSAEGMGRGARVVETLYGPPHTPQVRPDQRSADQVNEARSH